MKRLLTVTAIVATLAPAWACSRAKTGFQIETGTEVTVEKKDGGRIGGRLVEADPAHVVVEGREGLRTSIPRSDIAALRAVAAAPSGPPSPAQPSIASTGSAAEASGGGAAKAGATAAYREVTIPAGTVLPSQLRTGISSDSSRVEDRVRATLLRPITVEGVEALPAGTALHGHVTAAERSARVKGRAFVAFRFTSVDPPGDAERTPIRTEAVTRLAPATKKQDAAKIGGGAAGGAIVGGLLGGGDGAAKGAAIGGAAGTGVVLSTRGKEVRLGPGTDVSVRLTSPLIVRVPVS